jgi:hypothetical protein
MKVLIFSRPYRNIRLGQEEEIVVKKLTFLLCTVQAKLIWYRSSMKPEQQRRRVLQLSCPLKILRQEEGVLVPRNAGLRSQLVEDTFGRLVPLPDQDPCNLSQAPDSRRLSYRH